MWAWVIINWRSIVSSLGTAALIVPLAFFFHGLEMDKADKDKFEALEAQKAADLKQCNADKAITQKTGQDYEDAISALNRQLTDLGLRLNLPNCVVVGDAPGQHNGRAAANVLPGSNDRRPGLNPAWLVQYAGDAEKTRLQLIGCQNYIKKISK